MVVGHPYYVYINKMNVLQIHLFSMTFLDIDECALPTGGHICSYRCHNTPGSFHCSCPVNGYTLAVNGRSCQGELCNVMLQSCGVCWRPFFPSFGKKIMLVTFKTLFVFQILMNVWQEAIRAQRIKAASMYREDSDACLSSVRTITDGSERREYLNWCRLFAEQGHVYEQA